MRSWDEVKKSMWEQMGEEEKAEFIALGPEVSAELHAAEIIYQARIQAGLTQKELAARAGMTQNHISALENGSRVPTMATLAKVAAATGKKLSVTFQDVDGRAA